MQYTLKPYVTAGIAIVGATLIATTPTAPPPPNVQQLPVRLVDHTVDADWSQLASAASTDVSALDSVVSTTHWVTDPDISQGLSTLFSDVLHGTTDPVTNPISLLIEGADALLNPSGATFTQLSDTIADEVSAIGGGDLTSTPTILEPGSLDLGVNLSGILGELAPSGSLSLPFSVDSLLSDIAPSGTLSLPVSLDDLLGDAATGGSITLPFSLDSLLGGAAGDNLTLPISLDDLLGEVATNGNLSLPITLDQLLGDALGGGGSLSLSLNEEQLLGLIAPNGITVSGIPIVGHVSVSLATIESALGLSSSSSVGVSIPDSTILSGLESALGSTGSSDISVPLSSLENLLGTAGSSDISVSTATLEGLLGTSGSSDISLSVSDLETLLGSSGSSDISLSLATIEGLFGSAADQNISLPISTLEGLLPSSVSLDLDVPGLTGGSIPTFDVDLAQDLLGALEHIPSIAADLGGTAADPTLDVTSLLGSVLGDLGLPLTLSGGDLTLNLTGALSELLAGLY